MLSTLRVPPLTPRLMPRLELRVNVALVFKVPPFRVKCAAVTLPGAVPKLPSADTTKVPALIVVLPLKVLAPERVRVPLPIFTKLIALVALLIVPENVEFELLFPTVSDTGDRFA